MIQSSDQKEWSHSNETPQAELSVIWKKLEKFWKKKKSRILEKIELFYKMTQIGMFLFMFKPALFIFASVCFLTYYLTSILISNLDMSFLCISEEAFAGDVGENRKARCALLRTVSGDKAFQSRNKLFQDLWKTSSWEQMGCLNTD